MKAVVITRPGGPEVLELREVQTPQPGVGEILVRVHAVGINRADLIQRSGNYPAPKDAPQDIPGLEYAGEVAALGPSVSEWQVGDRVYGLAGGGTYAEYLCVPARTAARIPDNLSYEQAGAIPEAFVTAYDAIVTQCGLSAGEKLLITAVGSGVGTAAVQIATAIGATAYGTARSQEKLKRAEQLGLRHGIHSPDGRHGQAILDATGGSGVDVVLELVGGSLLGQDVQCVAAKGRIVLVGLMAGARTELDLALILRKRLIIRGTTLRMRPLEEKILAGQLLGRHLSPLFSEGKLKPIIDATFSLAEAVEAHRMMEANKNFGKIVLKL